MLPQVLLIFIAAVAFEWSVSYVKRIRTENYTISQSTLRPPEEVRQLLVDLGKGRVREYGIYFQSVARSK